MGEGEHYSDGLLHSSAFKYQEQTDVRMSPQGFSSLVATS